MKFGLFRPKLPTLENPVTKEEIHLEAVKYKQILVIRYDREQAKIVEDIITADMPLDEILL